jgi:glycosyltransferase involved in cell wall biosynthesis
VGDYRAKPADKDRKTGGSRPRRYVEDRPLVTIIMPVRNAAAFIEKAIESIIAQDYPNIEFLVADGRSTDGTVDILQHYDPHITHWLSEKDVNSVDASNKLCALASGDYLTILLADDWIAPDYVSRSIGALEREKTDFVFGDLELYDDRGKFLYRMRGNPNYRSTIRYDLSFTTPSWTFRRGMLEKIGLFKLLDVAPDYEWFLRADIAGYKGAHDSGITYCFRFGGNSSVNVFLGYQEVRRLAIAYGASPAIAWYFYLRKTIRHRGRDLLAKLLPMHLMMALRRKRREIIDNNNRRRFENLEKRDRTQA